MAIDFDYTSALAQALSPINKLGDGQLSIAMLDRSRREKIADVKSEREHQLEMRKSEIAAYAEKDLDLLLLKRGLSTGGTKEQKEERLSKSLETTAVNTYKYLKAQKGDRESELNQAYDEYKNSATVTADNHQKVEALKTALRDPTLDSLPKAQRAKLQAAAEGKGDPDAAVKAVSEYMTKTGWFSDKPERGRLVLDAYYNPLVKSLEEKKAISVMALKSKFDYVSNELKGVESSISRHMVENGAFLPQSIHDTEAWRVKEQGPPLVDPHVPKDLNAALNDDGNKPEPEPTAQADVPPPEYDDPGLVGRFKSGTQNIADTVEAAVQDPSKVSGLLKSLSARAGTSVVSPLLGLLPNSEQIPGVIKDFIMGRKAPSSPPPTTREMLEAIDQGRFNPAHYPGGKSQAKEWLLERNAVKMNPGRRPRPGPDVPPAGDLKSDLKQRVEAAMLKNPKPVIFKVEPAMIDKIRSLMETEGGADESAWNDFVTGVTDQSPAHITYFNEMVKEIVLRENSPTPQ